MKTQLMFIAASLLMSLAAHADPSADLAKEKCVKCHNATSTYARIEGQSADYLLKASLDYKSKNRPDLIMFKRVLNFDDATLKGLAEYFSKLETAPGIAGDAALIAQGKDLYENGIPAAGVQSCAACHGNNGEGGGFGSKLNPKIAGQLSSFSILQMTSFKTGSIANETDMTAITKKLTDAQIKALAEYMQSI